MTRKLTIRIESSLYEKLWKECQRYGYRSLSSYICKLLQEQKLIEIAGGHELTTAIHQVKMLAINDQRLRERREELCQLFDLLMIEIEKLRSCVESYAMRHEKEQ